MASDKHYKSPKPPGTREEDSWLSDEQLARCAPAEQEPFQSPVPTRMVANGEYMPFPQTQKQKHVEQRIQDLADKASNRTDNGPRAFPGGAGGMAPSFLATHRACGHHVSLVHVEET